MSGDGLSPVSGLGSGLADGMGRSVSDPQTIAIGKPELPEAKNQKEKEKERVILVNRAGESLSPYVCAPLGYVGGLEITSGSRWWIYARILLRNWLMPGLFRFVDI